MFTELLLFLVIVTSLFILKNQVINPRSESIASSYEFRFFIFFNIVILLGAGSVLAYLLPETNSVLKRVLPGGFEWGLLGVFIFLFCWLLVCSFFNLWERKYCLNSINNRVNTYCSESLLKILTCIMLLSTFILIFVYGFPQYSMVSGISAQDLATIRTTGLHNSTLVPTIIRRIFAKELSVILSFIFLVRVVLLERDGFSNKSSKFLLYICLFCSVYNVSFELSKSKLVSFILIYYLLYCSCKLKAYGKKTNLSSIFFMFLFLSLLLILIFSLTYPEYNIKEVILYLVSRLFVSQISPYYYSVSLWVNNIHIAEPFDVILYLGEVFKIYDFQAPAQRLTEILFYDAYSSGRMNYLSSFLMGDVISMFGFYLLPLFSIYISLLLRGFYFIRLFAFPKDLFFGLGAAIIYGSNFMSSLFPFILSSSMLFIFIATFISCKRPFIYLPKRNR